MKANVIYIHKVFLTKQNIAIFVRVCIEETDVDNFYSLTDKYYGASFHRLYSMITNADK